jgi:hydroxyethylthiazole kinase-like uncharacterized protein yjeF
VLAIDINSIRTWFGDEYNKAKLMLCFKTALSQQYRDALNSTKTVVLLRMLGYKSSMLLFTPDKVYQLDKAAVEQDGFAEIELMQRAGCRVWQAIAERWPQVSGITVFAGAGNNGGDAFVVALSAHREGVDVQLLIQGDLSRQSDTSRHFKEQWEQAGGEFEAWDGQELSGEVIVDGLLGIGLQRELDDHWQTLIATINRREVPRIAIDIPSGLNGLTGNPQPVAVEAQLTVTFIGAKTGQYLADGPDYCGELIYEDLGVSNRVRRSVPAALDVIEYCQLPALRKKNTHKNHYGNLLIIGGDQGMSGAVALSAQAALRSGAGLVTALVHPDCRNNLASFCYGNQAFRRKYYCRWSGSRCQRCSDPLSALVAAGITAHGGRCRCTQCQFPAVVKIEAGGYYTTSWRGCRTAID